MEKLLVRLFVKNLDEKDDMYVRASYGILVSIVGIIFNLLLFLTKITIGFLMSSISVMSDGFNNLSDAASSIIGFIASKVSIRPADKEHPFGHGRAEYIAAFVVSFLILQVGITCMKNSIEKIIHPQDVTFHLVSIIILLISVVLKLWLGYFNRKIGNKINSNVMKATATDAFGDALITITTIISIVIGKITGLKVDGYMGIVISLFVVISGIKIAKETMLPLLGESIDKNIYIKLISKVESYEGVIGAHDLIIHNYGPNKAMATLHVEFPNTITIEKAHTVVDKIESDIFEEMGINIVIHVDPVDVLDEEYTSTKDCVKQVVKRFEEKASIHDFRIVRENNEIKLIFDMILPFDYKEKDSVLMKQRVEKALKEQNKKYSCSITTEHGFVSD